MSSLTLGSLFDGSGGFPLGGVLSGIKPIWASEVEPFPIRVTTKRMPWIKHYGDVSQMDGAKIEPVDIITFGSPCQDLSVAGKRGGLEGSRSSLFYEAIRIIKEMRKATNGKSPRWIVWENVMGAFSSASGDDFRCVLESLCGIRDEGISITKPKKWTKSGCIMGGDYSIAWRSLDAEYWGVPQRRKRIFLVADFNGQSAPKILFESEGLSGYSAQSFNSWKEAARCSSDGAGETSVAIEKLAFENHGQDARFRGPLEVMQTISCTFGIGGNNQPFVVETPKTLKIRCGKEGGGKGALIQDNKSATLSCNNDQTLFEPKAFGIGRPAMNQGYNAKFSFQIEEEVEPTLVASGASGVAHPTFSSSKASFFTSAEKELANTLVATDYKDPPVVNDTLPCGFYPQMRAECVSLTEEKSNTLINGTNPGYQNGVVDTEYVVRRLTPTECARLQGFPDWWCSDLETEHPTDAEVYEWYKIFETHRKVITGTSKPKTDKQIRAFLKNPNSDSAEYKMWGNGVALPCVWFVLEGIKWAAENTDK